MVYLMVTMRCLVYKQDSTSCTLALYFVPELSLARTCQCNRTRLRYLRALVIDRDRTKISNSMQLLSRPLRREELRPLRRVHRITKPQLTISEELSGLSSRELQKLQEYKLP